MKFFVEFSGYKVLVDIEAERALEPLRTEEGRAQHYRKFVFNGSHSNVKISCTGVPRGADEYDKNFHIGHRFAQQLSNYFYSVERIKTKEDPIWSTIVYVNRWNPPADYHPL